MQSTKTKNKKADLTKINKIRKLAREKGTPLLEVSFGRKSIRFFYRSKSGNGAVRLIYESRAEGIERELRRLER